jgi:hypothetical protein
MTLGYSTTTLYKPPCSSTRSDLFLNKPLPAKPLPEDPPEFSAMWSDSSDDSDSDSELTIDSTVASPSEPRDSTESYLIFVSSGSDDYGDLVDHPVPADRNPDAEHLSLGPVRSSSPPTIAEESRSRTDVESLVESVNESEAEGEGSEYESGNNSTTSPSDAQYGRLSQWSQNRSGPNHYFREKKWDFFPELATPSASQAGGRTSPALRSGKSRKKDGRLNVSKRKRWHSLDRPGLGLAYGVRDSIKTYVHRTLSRDSTEARAKDAPRPSTAPVDVLGTHLSFHRPADIPVVPHSDVNVQLRALSISTASTASEMPPSPASPRSYPPRQKQLAVPMSNYQKYGPAIWESPKKSKKKTARTQRYPGTRSGPTSPTFGQFSIANPTPPLSPPFKMQLQNGSREAVRVIQGGTSQVLLALDGAKKKMAESKDERRREQLKAQIKLIGPVNPHTYMQVDPWV